MGLSTALKNWGIKKKLILSYVLIVIIPLTVLGWISYQKGKTSLYHEITSHLKKDVAGYREAIDRELSFAKHDLENGRKMAKQIVENEAHTVIKLLDLDQSESLKNLQDIISKLKIGKTGYAFILDYQGRYVVSPNRQSDGKSLYNMKDSNGQYFVQEIIKKAKVLTRSEIGFHTYPWKIDGQEGTKEKIAALVHIPHKKWVVGLSAFFNDLVNDDIVEQVLTRYKNRLKSEKVGKTGYMFVMNSKGDLIFHPTSEGKNLTKYEFVQSMIKTKKGLIEYDWEGRTKITVYDYFEDKDWIIASGSYLSDFIQPIIDMRNLTFLVVGISAIVALLIALFLASGIVNPILKIIAGITDASTQVTQTSHELSTASQQLSSASTEQAASLEETSSSLEEITGMVSNNVGSAKQCAEISVEVNAASDQGNQSMQKLTISMEQILESNEKIMDLVKVIGEIGEKTEVIDEIVFQTKLLSFNASVEAERAGEHGRGFAVVAQEVGNLAQMSGKAATEISSIVKESIKKADAITSENKAKVESGNEIVKTSATQLAEIAEKANTVVDSINTILSASEDQARGIEQINLAVSQLDKATQENAATSEETASSSEELSAQAETLDNMVTQLKYIVSGGASVETNHYQVSTSFQAPKRSYKAQPRSVNSNMAPTAQPKQQMIRSDVSTSSNEWDEI